MASEYCLLLLTSARLGLVSVARGVGRGLWVTGRAMAPPSEADFGGQFWPSSQDLPALREWFASLWGGPAGVFAGPWASPALRHPRDFGGPARFEHLANRWVAAVYVVLTLSFFVYLFLGRLWMQVLKPGPGEVAGLWVDLPTDLPGSVDVSSMQVQPGSPAGFVRSCGRWVPVTSAVAIQRLRSRARWVRALEGILGGRDSVVGSFVRGRWVPDLPASGLDPQLNYVLGSIENGARCLGGGIELGQGASPDPNVYLVLDVGGQAELVFPELLGKLRQYALFRQRDEQLCGALRTRAIEWCKGRLLKAWVSDLAVAGAVSLAMLPSTHERLASVRVAKAIAGSPDRPVLA